MRGPRSFSAPVRAVPLLEVFSCVLWRAVSGKGLFSARAHTGYTPGVVASSRNLARWLMRNIPRRVALVLMALTALLLLGRSALAQGVEGVYRIEVQANWLIIKVVPGAPRAQFVGVVLDSNAEWGRRQIGQVVFQLDAGPDGQYVGSFDAGHLQVGPPNDWRRLEKGHIDPPTQALVYNGASSQGFFAVVYTRKRWDVPLPSGQEPSIVGRYTFESGVGDTATIDVHPGGPLYDFVGVLVGGTSAWYRAQVGQEVLQLNRIGTNAYLGRCNAYSVHESFDMNEYEYVEPASGLTSGELRVVTFTSGGPSVKIYHREGGPGGSSGPRPSAGPGSAGPTTMSFSLPLDQRPSNDPNGTWTMPGVTITFDKTRGDATVSPSDVTVTRKFTYADGSWDLWVWAYHFDQGTSIWTPDQNGVTRLIQASGKCTLSSRKDNSRGPGPESRQQVDWTATYDKIQGYCRMGVTGAPGWRNPVR